QDACGSPGTTHRVHWRPSAKCLVSKTALMIFSHRERNMTQAARNNRQPGSSHMASHWIHRCYDNPKRMVSLRVPPKKQGGAERSGAHRQISTSVRDTLAQGLVGAVPIMVSCILSPVRDATDARPSGDRRRPRPA